MKPNRIMKEITQEYIRELFEYKDGNLYWKIRRQGIRKDKKAGHLRKDGYSQIKINNKPYKTHWLIFLYHYGYLPKIVDHVDRNPSNNKIENLREATKSQNCMNRKPYKNFSSKYKGVSWHELSNKWMSNITINYKHIHLGSFTNEIDAALAYNNAAIKYFGEYAYLNKIES